MKGGTLIVDFISNILKIDAVANILGVFLGALLSIPAGLMLNHAWEGRANKAKRKQLLASLRGAVEHNGKLLAAIEEWINELEGYPFFNVDLVLLESTATLKYDLLSDIELCREIDSFRYELTHLSRKVDLLLDLEFDTSARLAMTGGSMYQMLRPRLITTITKHIEILKPKVDPLQAKLGGS